MKKSSLKYSLAFMLTLLLTVSCAEKKTENAEGARAPKIEIADIRSGQKIDVSLLQNKVVFVNFWASWCMPCKEEMPSIEALHREMLSNEKFVMVTILFRDDHKTVTEFMKSYGYTFPVFSDNDGISARNYGVTGVPETYLVDKKGNLRKKVIGPADWNSPEARNYINSLIAE